MLAVISSSMRGAAPVQAITCRRCRRTAMPSCPFPGEKVRSTGVAGLAKLQALLASIALAMPMDPWAAASAAPLAPVVPAARESLAISGDWPLPSLPRPVKGPLC